MAVLFSGFFSVLPGGVEIFAPCLIALVTYQIMFSVFIYIFSKSDL